MTTGSTDLDAILTGQPEQAEPTGETVETTEAAPPAAETAPETKPETKDDKPPPGHVPLTALQEERRKRQELEDRLKAIEAAKAETPKANLFEDPDGWEKALDERVERKLSAVRQESEQKFLTLVEQAARARHTDFEDMVRVFAETAKVTPGLIDEARNAPDPAEFMYRAGQNLKRVQEAGSIEALIEKAREEGRQEALKGKVTPKIPESLTEITSAPTDRQQAFQPKPLEALLPSI